MRSILSDLYRGELQPSEHLPYDDARVSVYRDSAQDLQEWMAKLVDGKAKEYLSELAEVYEKLIDEESYAGFRKGFTLGVGLVIETCATWLTNED